MHEDTHLGASWSYDPSTREFITFDTASIAARKGAFVAQNGLGGAMYWELSGDHPAVQDTSNGGDGGGRGGAERRSIVETVASQLGSLDSRLNHLHFPGSRFENLRKGMQ